MNYKTSTKKQIADAHRELNLKCEKLELDLADLENKLNVAVETCNELADKNASLTVDQTEYTQKMIRQSNNIVRQKNRIDELTKDKKESIENLVQTQIALNKSIQINWKNRVLVVILAFACIGYTILALTSGKHFAAASIVFPILSLTAVYWSLINNREDKNTIKAAGRKFNGYRLKDTHRVNLYRKSNLRE